MGQTTGIAWTRSSRNIWTGCTKIGPGCDGCYAEAFNRWTRGKNKETGQAINWGPGAPRLSHIDGALRDLEKWNRLAVKEWEKGTEWQGRKGFWPVFINSQSDFFDNEVPVEWRERAFPVIEQCHNLTLYFVTKRIGNVRDMVPQHWVKDGFPGHVRLLTTICNQSEADRDLPKLLALPCKNGVSYEPALGEVDWEPWLMCGLQWLIWGGESNQGTHRARPSVIGWGRSSLQACRRHGIPWFGKQMGSFAVDREGQRHLTDATDGSDILELPEDMRVREWPV